MKIIGSFVSPYVRKVLACMNLKGLAYEIDPITPFYGNDEFERLSPLRRIPVLIDGDFAISDSSVICAYLDEAYPGHRLYPADPQRLRPRALARGICRHPPRRRLHLGLVLPEGRAAAGVGRTGRRGADRQVARRGYPSRARLSRARASGRRLPVRRDRRSPTSPSPASSGTGLMPGSRPTPARWPRTAAFVERTLAHPAIAVAADV